jgi:TonB family protein
MGKPKDQSTESKRKHMSETWKQWEGRAIDGKFPLQSYLGGSDHSAVFLTVLQRSNGEPGKAAIKLIPRNAGAENQLSRWQAVRELNHPNLLGIYDAGRCKLDGTKLLYVVEEYAEENLAQILPERALTAEEAGGMLPPVLAALEYVHGKGLVHGRIQPSNVFAVGDAVKLSSDSLTTLNDKSAGAKLASDYDPPETASGQFSAASDVWDLGITLVEVLTQHPPVWNRAGGNPPTLPPMAEPFREIARQCLQVDAEKRCTVAEMGLLLRGEKPNLTAAKTAKPVVVPSIVGMGKLAPKKISKKWSVLVALAAALAIVFVLIPKPKPANSANGTQQQAETSVPSENSMSPGTGATSGESSAGAANGVNSNGVVRRVMPDVSAGGRRSIHGKIAVRVKVTVDAAGNVAKAKLESRRGSSYFQRVAVDAARDWKFSPAASGEPSREWKLEFDFTRAKTEASAEPVQR